MTPAEGNYAEAIRRIGAAKGYASLDLHSLSALPLIPKEINALADNLRELDISWCVAITSLESLGELTGLVRLQMRFCTAIPSLETLKGLDWLNMLDISSCDSITSLEPLAGHTRLTSLDLSNCEAVSSLEPLSSLTCLTELSLSGCDGISRLDPLTGLVGLTQLYISWCDSIASLEPLAGLAHLTKLDLSGCRTISTLEPLTSLVHLEELGAMELTQELKFPEQLAQPGRKLWLFGSAFSNLCDELISGGPEDDSGPTLVQWNRERDNGCAELRETKLILIGNGRTGKSSLMRALKDLPHREDEKVTHAIELWPWRPEIKLYGDDAAREVHVNAWDFGGQEIYHQLHRLFMGTRAVFVVLWNPWEEEMRQDPEFKDRKDLHLDDQRHHVNYWLDQIHAYCPYRKPQIILVRSHVDLDGRYPRKPLDWKHYADKRYHDASHIYAEEFSGVERSQGQGLLRFERVKTAIHHGIKEQLRQHMAREIPRGRWLVREQLRECQDDDAKRLDAEKQHRTIPAEDFDNLVREHCTLKDGTCDIDKARRFLHDIGALYYNEQMPEHIILDQRWVIEGIYTVIGRDENAANKGRKKILQSHGRFTPSDLDDWGWDKAGFTVEQKKVLLGFMKACNVAVPLIEGKYRHDNEDLYLAPAFLPTEEDPYVKHILSGSLSAAKHRRLATLTHDHLGSDVALHAVAKAAQAFGREGAYWRFGFQVTSKQGPVARMRWSPKDELGYGGSIALEVAGADAQAVDSFLRELQRVVKYAPGVPSEVEWKEDGDGGTARGRTPWPEPEGGDGSAPPEPQNIGVSHAPAKDGRNGPPRVGISYAGEDMKEQVELLVKELKARGGVVVGDLSEKVDAPFTIIEYRSKHRHARLRALFDGLVNSDLLIVLLTPAYWRSKFCMTELTLSHDKSNGEFGESRFWLFSDGKKFSLDEDDFDHWEEQRALENRSIGRRAKGDHLLSPSYAQSDTCWPWWQRWVNETERIAFLSNLTDYSQYKLLPPPVDRTKELEEWVASVAGSIAQRMKG